jgi:hypothetical protein
LPASIRSNQWSYQHEQAAGEQVGEAGMKLIEFPQVNTTYAKDQPEYFPLPAHRFPENSQGHIVCCWQLTIRERLRLLFTGRIWHHVLTFKQPLQPQKLSVTAPEEFSQPGSEGESHG